MPTDPPKPWRTIPMNPTTENTMPAKKTPAAKPLTWTAFKRPIENAYKAIDKRAVVRTQKPSEWVSVALPGGLVIEIRAVYILRRFGAGEPGWSKMSLRGTDFNGRKFAGTIDDFGANLYIGLANQANAHGITA